jgi:Protein of unknown function (DUF3618)
MRTCKTCADTIAGGYVSPASRTPDQIAADIATTRNRLAGTIDQLVYRAKPKTILERQLASTKASFYDSQGALRKDKIAIIAGAAIGVVAVIVGIRKLAG